MSEPYGRSLGGNAPMKPCRSLSGTMSVVAVTAAPK